MKRGLDASDVRRAVDHVIESGLDFFDVAAEESAESLVADAIRSLRVRDRVIAAYRIPAIAQRLGIPTRDTLPERLPPRYIVDRVESILRATRLDAIPLAQLTLRALWRSSSAWPEVTGTCARLVREGKVLDWAAFVDAIEDDTVELTHEPWLAAISVPYSLCERAADPILDAAALVSAAPQTTAAAERKLTILARRPLAGAALAGSLGPGAKLRMHDDRRSIDDATLERIAATVAKLARFTKQTPPAAFSCDAAKAQLDRNVRPEHLHVQTLAELALRFVVTRGAIALPRLHRKEHVADALIAAHSPPLPRDLIESIEKLDI
ncbi:MAG TPA: aldo/keto reductase [Kofleriaceae bacterium]|nr:aldo/keto reductase [Kofleriaceae bacterium]